MSDAESLQPPHPAGDIARRWSSFWFGPGSAANLGFCRMLAAGLFFYLFDATGWSSWSGMDEVLWLPTPLFDALDLRPLSGPALDALAITCKLALLLVTIGLATRSSAALAAVLTFYLLGLRQNVGKIYYADAVVPLVMTILAVARSGDRWSVDCLLRRSFRRARTSEIGSGEYTWPIRLVWLLTVMIFFAAGTAKLTLGGIEWVFSDQLRDVLLGQHHRPVPPTSAIGLLLAEHGAVCMMLAGVVVALELLSPLALVSARARAIIVPGLVVFTSSLPVLFGFAFVEHFALFVFWVPWERLGSALSSRVRRYAAQDAANVL